MGFNDFDKNFSVSYTSSGGSSGSGGAVDSVNGQTGIVVINKSSVGLANVDNTSDVNKPISISTQEALDGKASLVDGKVPSNQLPAFVDEIVEVASFAALPSTGSSSSIYLTLDNNKLYRWGGTQYAEVSQSIGLGETASTAYRGDKGKEVYDKVLANEAAIATKQDKGDYALKAELPDTSVFAKTADIPTKLPNPKALTINGKEYDGTTEVAVTIESTDTSTLASKIELSEGLNTKQDTLVAGDNITIDAVTNTISATGGSGSGESAALATDEEYEAGTATNKAPSVKQVKDDFQEYCYMEVVSPEPFTFPALTANGTIGTSEFAVTSSTAMYDSRFDYYKLTNTAADFNNLFHSKNNPALPITITFYAAEAFVLKSILFKNRSDVSPPSALKDFSVHGSTDGSSWELLYNGTNTNNGQGGSWTTLIENDLSFNFYRITVTSLHYAQTLVIGSAILSGEIGLSEKRQIKNIINNNINSINELDAQIHQDSSEGLTNLPELGANGTPWTDEYAVVSVGVIHPYQPFWLTQDFDSYVGGASTNNWWNASSNTNSISFYFRDALPISGIDIKQQNYSAPNYSTKSLTLQVTYDKTTWVTVGAVTVNESALSVTHVDVDDLTDPVYGVRFNNCTATSARPGLGRVRFYVTNNTLNGKVEQNIVDIKALQTAVEALQSASS